MQNRIVLRKKLMALKLSQLVSFNELKYFTALDHNDVWYLVERSEFEINKQHEEHVYQCLMIDNKAVYENFSIPMTFEGSRLVKVL